MDYEWIRSRAEAPNDRLRDIDRGTPLSGDGDCCYEHRPNNWTPDAITAMQSLGQSDLVLFDGETIHDAAQQKTSGKNPVRRQLKVRSQVLLRGSG